jgi:riboflavin biosynthesis pyrimidine reductase
MRALLPEQAGSVDLYAWYGRDWLETGGVRANFIASADGAVSASGLSRGLQTEGDNRVFAALRDLADVILVGAGTARAEGYAAVTATERRLDVRRRYGLPDPLPIAVVSGSLGLDTSSALFTGALPGASPTWSPKPLSKKARAN